MKTTATRRYRVNKGREEYVVDGRTCLRTRYEDQEVELELEVDVSALMDRLGARAAENRTGKTALLGGLVQVRVKGRRTL